jgi:hypothetical protein
MSEFGVEVEDIQDESHDRIHYLEGFKKGIAEAINLATSFRSDIVNEDALVTYDHYISRLNKSLSNMGILIAQEEARHETLKNIVGRITSKCETMLNISKSPNIGVKDKEDPRKRKT